MVAQCYQWACRRLYNEFAWSYDAVAAAVSLGRWDAWRRAILPFVTGDRVLEVGCGTGALLPHLALHAETVIGLDLSAAMLRAALPRALRANILMLRARAQAVPLPPASMDCAVSTFPAPYILDPASLAEIHRVLTPTGRLLIVGLWVEPQDLLRAVPLIYGRPGAGQLSMLADRFADAGFAIAWHMVDVAGATLGLLEATPQIS